MSSIGRIAAVAALAFAATAGARAETIEDYVRMDCATFGSLPLETQVAVLFWIDGWLSRSGGDMELDFIEVAYAIRDLDDQCATGSRITVGRFLDIRF